MPQAIWEISIWCSIKTYFAKVSQVQYIFNPKYSFLYISNTSIFKSINNAHYIPLVDLFGFKIKFHLLFLLTYQWNVPINTAITNHKVDSKVFVPHNLRYS